MMKYRKCKLQNKSLFVGKDKEGFADLLFTADCADRGGLKSNSGQR